MIIRGGTPLFGTVDVQGAKNAALPVMAASILLKGKRLTLKKVPDLYDINTMSDLLRHLGISVEFKNNFMTIDVPEELSWDAPAELVRKMRASSLVLGPLLTRCGKAVLPLPGGCVLGSRPIDFHLKGLTKMGAEIDLNRGSVYASAGKLKGERITLDFPSVGATENLMMAAALAHGVTYIENAAQEPEIINLADVLRLMGIPIKGDGTPTIRITGKPEAGTAEAEIIPDRIEAATYLIAGIITKGAVTVRGIDSGLIDAILLKLEEAGATIEIMLDEVTAKCDGSLTGIPVKTMPYPGFPTDTQPQLMAALSLASGTSVIHESVFDSRLLHINEFKKMGAKIELQDSTAIVTGVGKLIGAEVHASNLRAGAALILMGLAAEGVTTVHDLYHVWRGYEGLVDKLRSLGADIELIA
ncbi:MAG: UDP-N-acetylglucosamine 1-carboxyvinyltransferase [Synergistaceae bacterium]|jgi:UDP-N-acetylglucosamine 1-carboxyvinyltransferase|nr:UDP-N-acetylglucosamine 1-carboxyvinyltransferase [Synergistaceae bacterium]MCK9435871.1 UDP-N-acetylglucosamine 1-carboxyvinyltransferase [Synergistaceae bacterium]MDD2349852.1 UDP-N-acetylglucosamine 1-carboxyvinyltransferase [Synergistaceae bacterium]MDD3318397.1 UDP-N-acetylglucosamine 1-carboxyvinyltransferase [Synergistaceae bacterium]MDD3671941.1 UDP-N-acetylglucosamine 1-carboxyvinyltransferase [Synergistaceae bacterium]